MGKSKLKEKARAEWIGVCQQLGSISKAALRCGIARSTLLRWKMAVAMLCGVYPTNLFVTYILGPHIQELHPAFRTLIVAGCMVGLLTWVVMPKVVKPRHFLL